MYDALAVIGAVVMAAGLVATVVYYTPDRAGNRVRDQVTVWERRVGLPRDEELRADAVRRTVRRVNSAAVGGMLGCIAGVVALAAFGGLIGLVAYVMFIWIGAAGGSWMVHRAELRERQAAMPVRAASLERRRLRDYLTPVEIVGQYGMLVYPALAIGSCWWGLARDDGWHDPALGLVMLGCVGLVVFAGAIAAQLWTVRAAQPAGSELALRWEEAIRAQALRELVQAPVFFAQTLGLVISLVVHRLSESQRSGPLEVQSMTSTVGVWLMLVILFSGTRGGMRRSQRRFRTTGVS